MWVSDLLVWIIFLGVVWSMLEFFLIWLNLFCVLVSDCLLSLWLV